MKYFTKYLPVEGEIKEGDIFICTQPHGDRYTASSVKNGYVYTSPLSFRFRVGDCKIVKLFLCSGDIQVGDKVRIDEHPELERIVVKGLYEALGKYLTEPTYNIGCNVAAFKVIGEISSEATWIKEGDEFDDTEVCHRFEDDRYPRYSFPFSHFTKSVIGLMQSFRDKGDYKIGIKGPCGHFH